jgi:hypothetical protein
MAGFLTRAAETSFAPQEGWPMGRADKVAWKRT